MPKQLTQAIQPVPQRPKWYDAYKFLGRDLKMFWNRNGGKICTAAGTTGLFFAGAHACRKTYKIHDKLKKNGERLYLADTVDEDGNTAKKLVRKAKTFISCSAGVAKDYLPDIVIGGVSGYAISKGWSKEHKLYQGAAATVGVLAADFMNYRRNVISEHGPEADRRYLTTKRVNQKVHEVTLEDGTVVQANGNKTEGEGITVNIEPNMLRIRYSKETTPYVWSDVHLIRLAQLHRIVSSLEIMLKHGGHYTVNDVRREFYGVKGDVAAGAMFGRVWDPGNPEHPERGAGVNLHFEDDEDFMLGRTDSCWIIIDIDDEPLIETLARQKTEHFISVEG